MALQYQEAGKHVAHSAPINGARGQGNLGGARIGIVAKPSAEFVAGMLGTWLSGGVAVPLALSYPEAELLHVMTDSVCPWTPLCIYSPVYIFSLLCFYVSTIFLEINI